MDFIIHVIYCQMKNMGIQKYLPLFCDWSTMNETRSVKKHKI